MTVAARIEGSVVHRVARSGGESAGELRIIQPSGIIACAACVTRQDGEWYAEFASVIRTQRRLFDGSVYVPAAALQ
jgi:2-methylaconitate cis-trans-isomerase PrpF